MYNIIQKYSLNEPNFLSSPRDKQSTTHPYSSMKFISKSSARVVLACLICFAIGFFIVTYLKMRPATPIAEFSAILTIPMMFVFGFSYKIAGIRGTVAFLLPKISSIAGMSPIAANVFAGMVIWIHFITALILTMLGLEPIHLVACTRLHSGRTVVAADNEQES